jgi:hypothetical protein
MDPKPCEICDRYHIEADCCCGESHNQSTHCVDCACYHDDKVGYCERSQIVGYYSFCVECTACKNHHNVGDCEHTCKEFPSLVERREMLSG